MAYTTGHAAKAAGGKSNLYFNKTCDFLDLWKEGEKGGWGKRNPVN